MEVVQRQGTVIMQGNQRRISHEHFSDGVREQEVMVRGSRPLSLESFYSIGCALLERDRTRYDVKGATADWKEARYRMVVWVG